MHSIRVKHIQEEYQKYMERVRGKAQAAIDQANSQYQSSRNMLTARVDALVHFLQTRHLQVCSPDHPPRSMPVARSTLYFCLKAAGLILHRCTPSTVHLLGAVEDEETSDSESRARFEQEGSEFW